MSARSVSPPTGGSRTAPGSSRGEGWGRHVTSECRDVGGGERATGGDPEDLGLGLVLRGDGVDLEVAEAAPERDVRAAIEPVLVAEEDHLPAHERLGSRR